MTESHAVVAANARMGGAVTLVNGLAGAASATQAPVRFLVPPALVEPLEARGASVIGLPARSAVGRLAQARAWLREHRPPAALLLDNLPLRSGLPEVVVVHNRLLLEVPSWRDPRAAWLRANARRSSALVAPTRALARLVERLGAACTVVPHGAELPVPAGPVKRLPERLVHVGLPSPQKNLPVLLEALALLPAPVELRWTQDRSSRQSASLRALASRLGVEHRVVWLGQLSREAVAEELRSAAVFVFPSLSESFGLPLAEALAAGTAIVASDLDWAHEVCGDAASYADPGDPRTIACAVHQLLIDEGRRCQLQESARIRAARFCWRDTLRRYLEVLGRAAVDR